MITNIIIFQQQATEFC